MPLALAVRDLENKSYEDCEAIIDSAINEGINFIDIYNSNPEVRNNVGKALSKYPRSGFLFKDIYVLPGIMDNIDVLEI